MAGKKGCSGRRRKPTALKRQAGTARSCRDFDAQFQAGKLPPMPKGLHPTAQAEWIRLAPLCLELGVLTEGDWLAWTMGFTSYSTWLLASEQMGGPEAWTFSTESGYEQVSALFPIVKQAYAATLQFLREFGLTPGARGGLNITPPERKPPGTALGDLLN